MKTKLFELIGEIDEKYIEEADTTETPRRTFKRKQYWKVAIACICISILMLFTSICIASGWGTEIIEFYSIGQENYNESGYEMGVHIQKISERSLKGDIRKSKAIIKKQYKLHTVFSNWMPGHYQEEFRSQTESIDYVGYKGLREIRLSGTELGSTVNVYAKSIFARDYQGAALCGYIYELCRRRCYSIDGVNRENNLSRRICRNEKRKYLSCDLFLRNGKRLFVYRWIYCRE